MDMPEITKCFGMFPPKYGTYLISLLGIASGGVGVACIILFGVAEEKIMASFQAKNTKLDEDLKKVALMSIGFTSILLLIANVFFLIGALTKSRGAVATGVYVLMALCLIVILCSMGAPMGCFFMPNECLVKKVSSFVLGIFILTVTVYLEIWFYFMVVAWNYEQEL